jgi:hypothetical protein
MISIPPVCVRDETLDWSTAIPGALMTTEDAPRTTENATMKNNENASRPTEEKLRSMVEIIETGMRDLDNCRKADSDIRDADLRDLFLVASRMIEGSNETPDSMKGRQIIEILEGPMQDENLTHKKYTSILIQVSKAYRAIYKVPQQQPPQVSNADREVCKVPQQQPLNFVQRMSKTLCLWEFQKLDVTKLNYQFNEQPQPARRFIFWQNLIIDKFIPELGTCYSETQMSAAPLIKFCAHQMRGRDQIDKEDWGRIHSLFFKYAVIIIIIAEDNLDLWFLRCTAHPDPNLFR